MFEWPSKSRTASTYFKWHGNQLTWNDLTRGKIDYRYVIYYCILPRELPRSICSSLRGNVCPVSSNKFRSTYSWVLSSGLHFYSYCTSSYIPYATQKHKSFHLKSLCALVSSSNSELRIDKFGKQLVKRTRALSFFSLDCRTFAFISTLCGSTRVYSIQYTYEYEIWEFVIEHFLRMFSNMFYCLNWMRVNENNRVISRASLSLIYRLNYRKSAPFQ